MTFLKELIEEFKGVDQEIIEEIFIAGCAEGHDEGYDDGFNDGYDEGFDDGYDAKAEKETW